MPEIKPVKRTASTSDPREQDVPNAQTDLEHGSTGWNAYEVWRKRVFVPAAGSDDETRSGS
jgi:hypothetical protein